MSSTPLRLEGAFHRADLLAYLLEKDWPENIVASPFVQVRHVPPVEPAPEMIFSLTPGTKSDEQTKPKKTRERSKRRFQYYEVQSVTPFEREQENTSKSQSYSGLEVEPAAEANAPLVPWKPFVPLLSDLREAAGGKRAFGMHVCKTVKAVASGSAMAKPIPTQRAAWQGDVHLVFHDDGSIRPFAHDASFLAAQLASELGKHRIAVWGLRDNNSLEFLPVNARAQFFAKRRGVHALPPAKDKATAFFIADFSREAAQLAVHAIKKQAYSVVGIHMGKRSAQGARPALSTDSGNALAVDPNALTELVATCSLLGYVDFPMLRTLRQINSIGKSNPLLELAVWRHKDVYPLMNALELRIPMRSEWHEALRSQTQALINRVRDHIASELAKRSDVLRHTFSVTYAAVAANDERITVTQALSQAQGYFARLGDRASNEAEATSAQQAAACLAFMSKFAFNEGRTRGLVSQLATDAAKNFPKIFNTLPPGMSPQQAAQFGVLANDEERMFSVHVAPEGHWIVCPGDVRATRGLQHLYSGKAKYVALKQGNRIVASHALAASSETRWQVGSISDLELVTDKETVRIAKVTRPLWMRKIAISSSGHTVGTGPRIGAEFLPEYARALHEQRYQWVPLHGLESRFEKNQAVRHGFLAKHNRPCLHLTVKGVTQTFVWIDPGEFMMGSPEQELKREQGEGPQHKVVLTEGFWLANTACSQRFYQAVLEKLPKQRFSGDELPVTDTSWNMIQNEFLPHLNKLIISERLELSAALPSEAQWEYACRAGSETAFSTGATISTDQANFDGNYPYLPADRKGLYHHETLPVNGFEPNAWGLHQMHGNVWEWVHDVPRTYQTTPQTNPGDPVLEPIDRRETRRGLRGGSWVDSARRLRSAQRSEYDPVYRIDFIGFRLALRLASPGGASSGALRGAKSDAQRAATRSDAEKQASLGFLGQMLRDKLAKVKK